MVPLGHGFLSRPVQPALDAGIGLEVLVDQTFRLLGGDAELHAERGRSAAVGQPEIDYLGSAALLLVHQVGRHLEHLAGGQAVQISAGLEGFDEGGIFAELGQNAQLGLAIVAGD